MIESCHKCGIDLYEEDESTKKRKIFRSFGTRTIKVVEVHFCYPCYQKLNDKFMEEESYVEKREDD